MLDEYREQDFKAGDSVVIVDTEHDGMLGTVLGVRPATGEYLIVFEDGQQVVFKRDNLSHRY